MGNRHVGPSAGNEEVGREIYNTARIGRWMELKRLLAPVAKASSSLEWQDGMCCCLLFEVSVATPLLLEVTAPHTCMLCVC